MYGILDYQDDIDTNFISLKAMQWQKHAIKISDSLSLNPSENDDCNTL